MTTDEDDRPTQDPDAPDAYDLGRSILDEIGEDAADQIDLVAAARLGYTLLANMSEATDALVRLNSLALRTEEGHPLRDRVATLTEMTTGYGATQLEATGALKEGILREEEKWNDHVIYESILPGADGITDALNTQFKDSGDITAKQILIVPEVRVGDGEKTFTSPAQLQAVVDALHKQLGAQGRSRDDYEILIGAEPYVIRDGETQNVSFDAVATKFGYKDIKGAKLYNRLRETKLTAIDTQRVNPQSLENEAKAVSYRDVGDMMVVTVASAGESGSLESLVGGLVPVGARKQELNQDLRYAAKAIAGADGDVDDVYNELIGAVIAKNRDNYTQAMADVEEGRMPREDFDALIERDYRAMDSQALVDLTNYIQRTRNPDSLYIVTSDNGTVVGKRVMSVDAAATKLAGGNLEDAVYAEKTGNVMVVPIATEASKSFVPEEPAAAEAEQPVPEEAQFDYTSNVSSWRMNVNSERSYTDGVAEETNTGLNYGPVRGWFGKEENFDRKVTATLGEAYLLLTGYNIHCYGVTHADGEDNKEHYFGLEGKPDQLGELLDAVVAGNPRENLSELSRQVFTSEDQPVQENLFEQLATLYIKRPGQEVQTYNVSE